MTTDNAPQEIIKEKPLKKTTPRCPINYISLIAIILAGFALGFSLYSHEKNKNFNKEQRILFDKLESLDKHQSNFDNTIKNNAKNDQLIKEKMTNLNAAFQSFKEQSHYGNEDWLLHKTRYYLEIAQIEAHWGDNVDIIIALLQQADRVLTSINNANLFEVRQAIAKEIAHLETMPKVDLVGLLSRLDAQQDSVNNLKPQKNLSMPRDTPEKNTKDATWRGQLQNSMNILGKMVIIRHHDKDIKPLFSSLELALFRESVRNNLQEAKWGLLQNNEAIYQLALKQAKKNVARSFDMHADNTQTFIQALTELQAIHLTQPKPNIEDTIKLLDKQINAKSTEKTS